ncbi:MAG: L-fucose/L-arabinose isomerase family protein [Acidobacteriaceae bacterium]
MLSTKRNEEGIRLGVILIGRKRPGFDQEWNRMMTASCLGLLEQIGYTVVRSEASVVDEQTTAAALDKIQEARCEALLMLQPSMAHGQLALTVAQRWSDPVILWATPERPGDGKVSSCSLVGQHLWASSLRQAGRPFEFVYGDPADAAVREDLKEAVTLARAANRLRHSRVGLVGTHAPGFIDLAAEPFLLRRALGVQLYPFSLPQFIERVREMPDDAVRKDIQKVQDLRLPMRDVVAEDLAMNSRCYLAMRELMEEEKLDALAVQCWPELPNMLGQWPYLAVSRLSTEGRAVAIEGDVDGALTGLISLLLGAGAGFLTDWLEHDQSTIFFWHPGMAPMDMCDGPGREGAPTLAAHFNIVKPLVVDGKIRTQEPVTVLRLWRCDNRYHMTAMEGRTIEPRRKLTGNTALVEIPEGDVLERFNRLLHAGMPHHVTVSFGKHRETLRRLAGSLGLQWWD